MQARVGLERRFWSVAFVSGTGLCVCCTREIAPPMIRSVTFALLVCLASTLLACGASDEDALGGYNATCDTKKRCDDGQGLQCVGMPSGLCTTACNANGDCAVHGSDSVCIGAGVGVGYCYTACLDSVQCPNGLTCNMQATSSQSTCRPSP